MITAAVSLTALVTPARSEQIVGLSIPVDSMDSGCHPRDDGVWSVNGHPIPNNIGIGWMVNPLMDGQVVFHDHHYVAPNVPDPTRAIVTIEFDAVVTLTGMDIVEHTNGITQVEGFAGNSLSQLTSVGSVFGAKGDVTGGFQFSETEVNSFAFTQPRLGKFFQFIIRKTSLENGYAAYRVFLHIAPPNSGWRQRAASGPSARTEYALAFDQDRGGTLLFGGYDIGLLGDTWGYDGANWSFLAGTGPSARYHHALAYDRARGVTVLFGGSDTGTNQGDTWEWDGTAWTQRSPATSPSARAFHTMAYDSVRGVTVLFGGYDDSGYAGDTWEWNGSDWTQRATNGPSPRSRHGMSYDSKRGVTVLFGGKDDANELLGDTWEWNGSTWTQRMVSGPSPRQYPALAYDSARAVTVLFGGYDGNYDGDTWEWDGAAWTPSESGGPPARFYHAMAFDSARAATVLFGGWNGTLLGDTWEYQVCSGGEIIKKVACKASHGANQLKVILTGGFEGNAFTVSLTDGSTVSGTINSRGKGKAKFPNLAPGESGVATAEWSCGAVAEHDYDCP